MNINSLGFGGLDARSPGPWQMAPLLAPNTFLPFQARLPRVCGHPQWNPKYGCKGTVTTRFALIALVAWQY